MPYRRGLRTRLLALTLPIAAVTALSACTATPVGGQFAWFKAQAAPAGWHERTTTQGAALSYPPVFKAVRGDPGSISQAVVTASGTYDAYLNVTPQQGAEQLRGFGAFRLDHLHDEETAVHEISSRENLTFLGGRGSCVMDDYRTKIAAHHYEEIACLVVGANGGSVIVASALFADWSQMSQSLRESVDSFSVT